jgi:hypothetical protein
MKDGSVEDVFQVILERLRERLLGLALDAVKLTSGLLCDKVDRYQSFSSTTIDRVLDLAKLVLVDVSGTLQDVAPSSATDLEADTALQVLKRHRERSQLVIAKWFVEIEFHIVRKTSYF